MSDAIALIEAGEFAQALPLIEEELRKDPNDVYWLNLAGMCWTELNNDATALQFFSRCTYLKPHNPALLVNEGRALHELGFYQEALQRYFEAAELNPNYAKAYSNTAASLIQLSQWDDAAKACRLALDCDPQDLNAKMNLANCFLAKGELEKGWELYELSLGSKWRKEYSYQDETRWNGEKDKTIVVYGEQGLGDEIYFCESIPDLVKVSKEVHIDCDQRLAKLFQRSFPEAKVHGTRRADVLDWLDDVTLDHRMSMGSLPRFFRQTQSHYPKTSYLKADPEMVKMWKDHFKSFGKPVWGICSVGGTVKNNLGGRTITEDQWQPFIEKHDCVWVSLDYKGTDPGFAKSYHMATRSPDYDDTASLVAALDGVIGVVTSVLHLADAIGVRTIHLVPDRHTWKFAGGIPLFANSEFIHQNGSDWKEVLSEINL